MKKLSNGWTSDDKDKFKKGEEYWCFYLDTTNKGNKLRHRNGVSLYKCTKATKKWVEFNEPAWDGRTGFWDGDTEFELISGDRIHYDYAYMNGYGTAGCYFFNTEQEAKDGHDELVKYFAEGLNVTDQQAMYKKLFGPAPGISKEEAEAMDFYNKLPKKQKDHVKWLKYYSDI